MQFVTEKEVEDIKAKKQKEWEKVRKPDQPLGEQEAGCFYIAKNCAFQYCAFILPPAHARTERPEEEHDSRTLYEKLKVQRDQKQEEHAEQFKFSEYISLCIGRLYL